MRTGPGTVGQRVVPTADCPETFRRKPEALLDLDTPVRVATVDSIDRTSSGKRLAITSRIAALPAGTSRRTDDAS